VKYLAAIAGLMLAMPALAQTPALTPTASALTGSLIGPALFVSDIARSLRFYEALGLHVGMDMGPPQRHETMLVFGDPRNPGIILLSDKTATAPVAIDHGHGYDRTVMRIADLAAAQARLQAGGFATTPIRDVAMGYRMMLATDPDGYKFELVESHPRSQ
jgi:catechol 2,3-dioxygenase-like lactoylglutathione lyase family enzyme